MLVAFQSGIKEAYTAKGGVSHGKQSLLAVYASLIFFFYFPVPHGKFGPAHEVIVQRKTEGISSSSYLI